MSFWDKLGTIALESTKFIGVLLYIEELRKNIEQKERLGLPLTKLEEADKEIVQAFCKRQMIIEAGAIAEQQRAFRKKWAKYLPPTKEHTSIITE